MSVQRLGYLSFEVSDVQAWRSFMTQKLGVMEASGSDESARFRLDSRAWRLEVQKGEADDLSFAGFEVDSARSLAATRERLEKLGVEVTVESAEVAASRGVLGLLSCADPVGSRIEVYYGATELYEEPFNSPTGVQGFLTDDQGLGHYVVAVPDMDAALQFYVDGLGLNLSDIIDWQITPDLGTTLHFLHCNGRHHTLALAALPSPKKLHHFMLETKSMDDVGFAYDRFDTDGTVALTLGRHTNDHMFSFYGGTPSGFLVEYGWGARYVEVGWSVVRYDKISYWGHRPAQKPPV